MSRQCKAFVRCESTRLFCVRSEGHGGEHEITPDFWEMAEGEPIAKSEARRPSQPKKRP